MKWIKQWVDEGKPFETTYENAKKHLVEVYDNIEEVLKDLPVKQKIRNPFAYYWKEE